jgi:molybdate transport system substrate-binding protein
VVTLWLLFSLGLTAPLLAKPTEILIGAATSLQDALQELALEFQSANHDQVVAVLNFGASSELVRQAHAGAPFDVVMTADSVTMDQLEQRQLLAPGSRMDIIANELVLIVPRRSRAAGLIMRSPLELKSEKIARLALAAEHVPAGHYARLLLAKWGVLAALQPKIVNAPHVRATLALVASQAVDAGFVYHSDALINEKTVAMVYQSGMNILNIRYPAAVMASSRYQNAARLFVKFLQSPMAQTTFAKYGFCRL